METHDARLLMSTLRPVGRTVAGLNVAEEDTMKAPTDFGDMLDRIQAALNHIIECARTPNLRRPASAVGVLRLGESHARMAP